MKCCYFESSIGKLILAGQNEVLHYIGFAGSQPEASWHLQNSVLAEVKSQLKEYFAGKRTKFSCKYILQGTPFQQQVLKEVANILYGTTTSYGAIAEKINNPKAFRAVGTANATNRLPIIIPCHRVIGKNGELTGFGGGLATKEFLLNLEINR